MPNTKLVVTIDHTPHKIGARDKEQMIDTIVSELTRYNYTGKWRINNLQTAHFDKMRGQFLVKSITGIKGQSTRGIRFTIRTGNSRFECFSGILIPPNDVDITRVYAALNPIDQLAHTTPAIGEKFLGKISSVRHDGIMVRILPNNTTKYQCAFCPAAEISNTYIDDPRKYFLSDRYILVQIISTDQESGLIASRKITLPSSDGFDPMPIKRNNRLQLRKFMANEERMLFALTTFCTSVEKHATKEAWKRSEVGGGVFMKDKHHACAPAEAVHSEFRRELIKQFSTPTTKPSSTTRFDQIVKDLHHKGYIHIVRDGQTIIAYCMLEKGYRKLGRPSPPLPEYYEYVKPEPVPELVLVPEPVSEPIPIPIIVEATPVPDTNGSAITSDLVQNLASQIKEYREKKSRLVAVEKQLEDLEFLRIERDEIKDWLNQHAGIPTLIDALKE